MEKKYTGSEIRQSFIDYFNEMQHTHVPSSSLVPGGDQTLLFTNAGMVQFKDIFLGTDSRPYTRAVNSQKVMRVAGKHNDLDEVGRDDSHHTFFEMLGNWSFGDYYKNEAIAWAWDLLTNVWGLDKSKLWATCFKDEKGQIPADDEAAEIWRKQPGMDASHVLYFGRKDNFWEMADTGPCGPCSEIHIDLGPERCNMKDVPGHICGVNGDCARFLELWNLVFIQYNRINEDQLEPLPATHVDTGMGFERIVSVLQNVSSNYKTDLLFPIIKTVQKLVGQTDEGREANLTPYRVIADHGRAVTFLISDGVVPGNIGRNYVCRMIIRRAALFGRKLGLFEPFLAEVAETVVGIYGEAYPDLVKNKKLIQDQLTREENRFRKTVEFGLEQLQNLISELKSKNETVLDGATAFDLYATHGLPFEITRDITREYGVEVDEAGFKKAMDEHRIASGAGKAFGKMGGEDAEFFHELLDQLISDKKLGSEGVQQNPYSGLLEESEVILILKDGEVVNSVSKGDLVEVVLNKTPFYIESGGQVSDTGMIFVPKTNDLLVKIQEVRKPIKGIVVHKGVVQADRLSTGETVLVNVEEARRFSVMRNHTATHLLHSALHKVLGDHARQAGSLVAPDYLRFDFTHPEAMTQSQIREVELLVNQAIYSNFEVVTREKTLEEAMSEGAMALFGEKYADSVRTITIGDNDEKKPYSYELCGGTHVRNTSEIGMFFITSESSIASGVRRIEAVTGMGAYKLAQRKSDVLSNAASLLSSPTEEVPNRIEQLQQDLDQNRKNLTQLRQELVKSEFEKEMENVPEVDGIRVLSSLLPNADSLTLRNMADIFREKHDNGVIVLASVVDDKPILVAAVSDGLVKKGLHAGKLIKEVAAIVGGGGGGKPTLAQAGGKDAARIPEALNIVLPFIKEQLK